MQFFLTRGLCNVQGNYELINILFSYNFISNITFYLWEIPNEELLIHLIGVNNSERELKLYVDIPQVSFKQLWVYNNCNIETE